MRAFSVLSPLLMLAAIVLTANHYVVDALAGAIVALLGLAIAYWLRGSHFHPLDTTRGAGREAWHRARVATSIVLDPRPRTHVRDRRAAVEAGHGGPLIFIA